MTLNVSFLFHVGGHTTEIIRLMGSLSQSYNPRHYVIADSDKMSEEKIRTFEAERERRGLPSQVYTKYIFTPLRDLFTNE